MKSSKGDEARAREVRFLFILFLLLLLLLLLLQWLLAVLLRPPPPPPPPPPSSSSSKSNKKTAQTKLFRPRLANERIFESESSVAFEASINHAYHARQANHHVSPVYRHSFPVEVGR